MAYIYATGELYPSCKPCYVNVGENQPFTVYENSTTGGAATKIFSGKSYSGEFNLSSVVDVSYDFGDIMYRDWRDTSYGGFTKSYTVEDYNGTKTDYRFFYSPWGGNYTTTDRTFNSNYEPIVRKGTYTWTLRVNADGLSSLDCNFGLPLEGETRVEKCGDWWVLYFFDERALPAFIYLDGKVTITENKVSELSITTLPYQDVDADEMFKKKVYQKNTTKKFTVNTGYLNETQVNAMERVMRSPECLLMHMKGQTIRESYRVTLTSSSLQTTKNNKYNQNNFQLTFESIYENIIR